MGAKKIKYDYEDLNYFNPQTLDPVYGPFASRRYGRSIGINLYGKENKICSYNCPHCDLGATTMRMNRLKKPSYPRFDALAPEITKQFQAIFDSHEKIETICIAGYGEPTLHHDFPEAVGLVKSLRDNYFPQARVVVISNGAHLDQKRVVEAMNSVDERVIKLDVGNDRMLKVFNAPLVRTNIAKILLYIKTLKDITIQSFFSRGSIDNTTGVEIEEWIEIVGLIAPQKIYISTLRNVATGPGLEPCDEDTLFTIASRLERKIHIKAKVFPGP